MANIISSGTSTITSGETLYYPSIIKSGRVVISSGGIVSGAVIEDGGMEVVSSGGRDYGAAISSGGEMRVMMNGLAFETVVSSASLQVSGGRVDDTIVGKGASLVTWGASSGSGSANGIVSGASVVSGGNLVLNTNAVGNSIKVLSGYVFVSSGGYLQASIASGGPFSSSFAEIVIEKGGWGHNNTVDSRGIMVIRSGGKATTTTVYFDAEVHVSNGGLMSGGSIFNTGLVCVQSGGSAVGVNFLKGGILDLKQGGVCIDPVISSGVLFMSGGKMSGADVQVGSVYVYSGGSTRSCSIASGLLSLIGASSIEDTILGSGIMTIEKSTETGSMGYAEALTIEAMGQCKVSSGGSVHGGTVGSGGYLSAFSGACIDGVNVMAGGDVDLKSGAYHSGGGIFGYETIGSGASADKLNVMSGGNLLIRGRASGGMIYAGGEASILGDGVYLNVSAGSNASLFVHSGGVATVASAGALKTEVNGALALYSGAAYSCIVRGRMILAPGSGFSGTSAARVTGVTVERGGTLEVSAYCSAVSAFVYGSSGTSSGGSITVSSGGLVSRGTVEGDIYVRAGASMMNMDIRSSGYAAVSGFMGQCFVSGDASVRVYYGGSAYQTTVGSGGFLSIANGAKCDIATIASSGTIAVSSGATATNIYINNGYGSINSSALISGCSVQFAGYLSIYGTGADVTITSGGSVKLWADALINSATIQYGGTLDLASRTNLIGVSVLDGGKVTVGGPVTLSAGGLIFTGSAGKFDFNISYVGLSSAGNALVKNFDAIAGTPLYSLTVSETQKKDTYVLATNASKFGSSTITVRNAYGTSLGTLALDSRTRIGDKDYTLNLSGDNVLSVTVGAAAPASAAKGDVDGNGISDVLFQYSGGDYQIGYWMNGTNEWRGQGLAKPAEWEILGSYDMNNNGKADCVLVGNVTTEIGGKGAYIGYYIDSVDTDANWQNIGYLNNEEDIAWKNKVGNLTGNAGMNSIVWYAPELYAVGVWTDGTTDWVTLSNNFGGDDWTLVGCGDFDGDGKDSVVMNYNNGQLIYAVGIGESAVALGSANWFGWDIRAIGDFAGDGKEDLVLFHTETGSMVMCADGNVDSFVSIGQLAADDWFVVGAGDYNNDQKDDLLVRQKSTGMLGYYISGDTSQWVEMGRGVDMKWTVIA